MSYLPKRVIILEAIVIIAIAVGVSILLGEAIARPNKPENKGVTVYTPGRGVTIPCVFTVQETYELTVEADFTVKGYVPVNCDIYWASYDFATRELIVFNVSGVGGVLLVLNEDMRFIYDEENQ